MLGVIELLPAYNKMLTSITVNVVAVLLLKIATRIAFKLESSGSFELRKTIYDE